MISCMLCSEIEKEKGNKLSKDYIFEIKFDGERAWIYVANHKVEKIVSRRGNIITKQFPEFQSINFEFEKGIIDSEIIVATNGKDYGDFDGGISMRTHLQGEKDIQARAGELRAKIMAFDLIELGTESLRFKPLVKRYEILQEKIKDTDLIVLSKWHTNFDELWRIVEIEHLEGVIAKNINTAYEGVRSKFWIKIKNWKEAVVEFNGYEKAESEKNPFYKGIILTNSEGIRCSCLGKKSEAVKNIIDEQGVIKVVVQYLESTQQGKARFITFKEVAK